jgi:glutathione-regulated potassium-efflux system protein KefB
VLALGGEFAFVVFAEAMKAGLLDEPLRDRLVAVVGCRWRHATVLLLISRVAPAVEKRRRRAYDDIPDEHPQVLIAGFGRFGQIVARLLWAQKIPFIAIDPDDEQVDTLPPLRQPGLLRRPDPPRTAALRWRGAGEGVRGRHR